MDDLGALTRALELAEPARAWARPNPWVGCVIVSGDEVFEGVTASPGGPHAEVAALSAAGSKAHGSTLYTTLEPCAHHGRTPPCAEAIVDAGVARVVYALEDPDPLVSGKGVARLRQAGIPTENPEPNSKAEDIKAQVERQLESYIKHRKTGRPWVILKLAVSLDGRIAAPDGSSRWITGAEARADSHKLRLLSDAVLVGAGTVRSDDPELTTRPSAGEPQPIRVVLGRAEQGARVQPAVEMSGDLESVLDQLGEKGVLQLLVEGGAKVAHSFHSAGLVDRYVFYVAPAIFGGDDAVPMFSGSGAGTMEDVWRGRVVSVGRLGPDLRLDVEP